VIIGQTVFVGSYFVSPWFPRKGDTALFAAEVIAAGGGTLVFGVQTKNSEDVDVVPSTASTGTVASSNAMTAGTIGTVTASGLKELVRFAYVVSGTSGEWTHFRVLPPAWRMNGA
jgi:hypothetical protein